MNQSIFLFEEEKLPYHLPFDILSVIALFLGGFFFLGFNFVMGFFGFFFQILLYLGIGLTIVHLFKLFDLGDRQKVIIQQASVEYEYEYSPFLTFCFILLLIWFGISIVYFDHYLTYLILIPIIVGITLVILYRKFMSYNGYGLFILLGIILFFGVAILLGSTLSLYAGSFFGIEVDMVQNSIKTYIFLFGILAILSGLLALIFHKNQIASVFRIATVLTNGGFVVCIAIFLIVNL